MYVLRDNGNCVYSIEKSVFNSFSLFVLYPKRVLGTTDIYLKKSLIFYTSKEQYYPLFNFNIFFFSYLIEQQTCFLTLCDRQFSRKTAFSFLEDLAAEFHSQYGHKINTATRPYSFIEFDTYIQKAKKNYAGNYIFHINKIVILKWKNWDDNSKRIIRNLVILTCNFESAMFSKSTFLHDRYQGTI